MKVAKSYLFLQKPFYSALMFFGTLGVLSMGYAGFVTLQSSDADTGKPLTSSMMQAVIGNLADLDSRVSSMSGAVTSLQGFWGTVTGGIGYSGGNVGIGTSAPGSSLHVYRDTGSNAEIDIQSTAGASKHWAVYNDRSSNSLRFWNNDISGEKNILTLRNNGNVGIGTINPVEKLHIKGYDWRDITFSPGSLSPSIKFVHNDNGNDNAPWASIKGLLSNGGPWYNYGHLIFSTAPNTTGSPAVIERMRIGGNGEIIMTSMAWSYVGDSAFVCINNSWQIYASETACH